MKFSGGTGLPNKRRSMARAEPELPWPYEGRARSPRPDGCVDLKALLSGYTDSGSAVVGRRSHGVGKRSLQHGFCCDALKLGPLLDVPRQVFQNLVKMSESGRELRKLRRAIGAADEESARVAQHAVHVTNHLWGVRTWGPARNEKNSSGASRGAFCAL